jgi:hypothetical protein
MIVLLQGTRISHMIFDQAEHCLQRLAQLRRAVAG